MLIVLLEGSHHIEGVYIDGSLPWSCRAGGMGVCECRLRGWECEFLGPSVLKCSGMVIEREYIH